MTQTPQRTDVLVVGAGPAGAPRPRWAARAGHDVVLADAAVFPRDKTCGDGLTPRAIAELRPARPRRLGARPRPQPGAAGGRLRPGVQLPWPGGSLPDHGSAVPRTELDARIRRRRSTPAPRRSTGARAVDVDGDGDRVTAVVFTRGDEQFRVACGRLVVADGVRSPLGRVLGREWHRDTAYGVAAAATSLRPQRRPVDLLAPGAARRGGRAAVGLRLGVPAAAAGEVNIGVGTLATARRPAEVALKALLESYTDARRDEWQIDGPLRAAVGRCCRWAARCPASPAPTGR